MQLVTMMIKGRLHWNIYRLTVLDTLGLRDLVTLTFSLLPLDCRPNNTRIPSHVLNLSV